MYSTITVSDIMKIYDDYNDKILTVFKNYEKNSKSKFKTLNSRKSFDFVDMINVKRILTPFLMLTLTNELQFQDSDGSDDDFNTPTISKTEVVCNLAQIPPEIWMILLIEAKE
jgi:hypothetical protein